MDLIKFWIAIFGFAKASLFGSSRNLACALMWRGRTRGHNPTALGIWSRGRAVFARYPPGGTERSGPRNNANSLKFSNSKFSQVEKNSIRKPSKTSHEPHASKHERSEPDPQQAKTICIVAWQARAPDIIATQADADTASCRSWPSGVLAEPRKTPMLGYAFRVDAIPKLRFPAPAMPRLSLRRQRESV